MVQVLNLLKVLVMMIYFCHWNACIWWLLGNPESLLNSEDPEARRRRLLGIVLKHEIV